MRHAAWTGLLALTLGATMMATNGCAGLPERPAPYDTVAARYRPELADLHVIRAYRPMKASYILGGEVLSDLPPIAKPGEPFTLIDVKGQGSLRHIWETHHAGEDPFTLAFFIDGETEPSITGKLSQLIRAAQTVEQPFVMNAGGQIEQYSNNLYLPIPFQESLKVVITPTDQMGLIFMQLDYRVEDDSMAGLKLAQDGRSDAMTLRYEGIDAYQARAHRMGDVERLRYRFAGNGGISLEGPGVIRRLAFNKARPGVKLRIKYDDEHIPAVDADLADFFGPFRNTALNNNACYFPMPFKEAAAIRLEGASENEEWLVEVDFEELDDADAFPADWGYFHARSAVTGKSTGYDNHEVLYTRGQGHFVAMSLYDTGHDHGGGDFAIVDGESSRPAFLRGVNGEDYFSFAYFGHGENFPYSEAFLNETGRMRVHVENPYPFSESLNVSWAALRELTPRSVAYWYQRSPAKRSLSAEESAGLEWGVFGPVGVPTLADKNTPDTSDARRLFGNLPSPLALDAGEPFDVSHKYRKDFLETGTFQGWARQRATGHHLNLTYVYRHVLDLGAYSHMNLGPRAVMAQARLESPKEQEVAVEFSYDDPIEVTLNGASLFTDMTLRKTFTTVSTPAFLRAGENRILVRMADTPGSNVGWAGFSMRVLDASGEDITLSLQPPLAEGGQAAQEASPE